MIWSIYLLNKRIIVSDVYDNHFFVRERIVMFDDFNPTLIGVLLVVFIIYIFSKDIVYYTIVNSNNLVSIKHGESHWVHLKHRFYNLQTLQ